MQLLLQTLHLRTAQNLNLDTISENTEWTQNFVFAVKCSSKCVAILDVLVTREWPYFYWLRVTGVKVAARTEFFMEICTHSMH